LASKGWSIEQIVDELARYPNGIALKFADRLQEEVTRSFKKWQDKNPAKTLPIIRCAAGQIARMVDEAEVALIDANIPIFVRGKMLVEPITVQRQAAHDRTTLVTAFSRLGERKLSYQLNKYAADFQRYDLKRKKWVLIDPPENITSALLTLRDWRFPEVVGIVNAPTMRPDGSILSELGYDPATRLWCNSDIELPPIADKPSRAQAVVALQLVKALLAGFPFVGPVDWAVALAAIQSAVLRGAFDLVPLMAILAHASGTGKSYLVDLIATIITGRKCPVITGSKSGEEMEKRLGVLLLEGSSMTSLDNLSQDIEGDLLAQMVTQNFIKPRILGKSEMPECEWRGMLFATGNNIRVVGDMIRRTLVCQLDAKLEHPEQRKFPFDAIQRILDNRGSYIAAAITIARAYAAASSPKANSTIPLNGFDSWSKVVREPLIWLGEADPVASMEAARAADPERVAAQELMTLWSKCIGVGKLVSTRSIIATANDHRFPSFRAFLIEHVGGKGDQIDSVGLGKWLQKESGRVYGNLRINVVSHRGRGNEYVMNKIDG
jgi:putative DNA primase/helicase